MARDPEIYAHQEWIGFVQPVGLVVSIPALLAAGVIVNRNIAPIHQRFLSCLRKDKFDEPTSELADFRQFVESVLEWESGDLVRLPENVETTEYSRLEIAVPEYGEVLRPTFVVPEFKPKEGQSPWIMLVQELDGMMSFDDVFETDRHKWQASPHAKFERLLRESEVPIGLLVNQTHVRLIYAPRGETSGYITFELANMIPVAGRPILGALYMLLSNDRLFRLGEKERLPALLTESRKYQNTVSTKLAEQVLDALYELLRGFQAANEQSHGQLLGEILDVEPDHVYSGLLTVLMRLVFIMYAEDRNLLSSSPVYSNFYSVSGLFERLREDEGRYPDTMEHRFGGWSQLLSLFRIIFDGASHNELTIPQRKGHLFDPDRYPFLEGRINLSDTFPLKETIPHVSDGVIYRVLRNLLILDGERLSYRTLDVEQIGSVYEAIMGFRLVIAQGNSIAIKPKKTHGAPVSINLDELLTTKPSDRAKWLRDRGDQDVNGAALEALKRASTVADLLAALEKKIAHHATPHLVPPGNMILQPSDERRNSGSHYTPRLLTEPIVRRTLSPIFDRLGPSSTPQQILDLKVCDPAMGSGAFLVEACRQLGDELVKAWQRTNSLPTIPPDEDEVLHARRLIAQRCLYGVDKNAMAVDLAKLSLWLATLAKDHPFTFLDHTLRCGDSLVGLTKDQIIRFHWEPTAQREIDERRIKQNIKKATDLRKFILENAETTLYPLLQLKLAEADKALEQVRLIGGAIISTFFSSDNDRARLKKRDALLPKIGLMLDGINEETAGSTDCIRNVDTLITPFHWEIEFPEVFDRPNGGFDIIVGNPPFAGKNTLSANNPPNYIEWLKHMHEESHGNSDLVAHFFRRAFNLLRSSGAFGLIATITIRQGDTRSTGLRYICKQNGCIYSARRRMKWPGHAAVTVSVVHVQKDQATGTILLDDKPVERISAFLFHAGGDDDPERLVTNNELCYQGPIPLGAGFMFDDTDSDCNSLARMYELIQSDERNAQLIHPYLGGDEILNEPQQAPHRFAIQFGDMTEEEARMWPNLFAIIEERVKPKRLAQKRETRARYWWRWGEMAPALHNGMQQLQRTLVHPFAATYLSFAFVPSSTIVGGPHYRLLLDSHAAFAVLQSRIHEIWVRFFGSTLEDRLLFAPSDTLETFSFPVDFASNSELEAIGAAVYEFRSELMIRNQEGLTKTYNRFHDPMDKSVDIIKLRDLHQELDQVVINAYGWNDLSLQYDFILEYQDEEDEKATSSRTQKRPWRYRCPDDLRDEILARLLALNMERVQHERLTGLREPVQKGKSRKKTKKTSKNDPQKVDTEKSQANIENQSRQLSLTEIES